MPGHYGKSAAAKKPAKKPIGKPARNPQDRDTAVKKPKPSIAKKPKRPIADFPTPRPPGGGSVKRPIKRGR